MKDIIFSPLYYVFPLISKAQNGEISASFDIAIQKMIEVINPNLRFNRDYMHVRPYKEFCLEFIELSD